MVHIFHCPFKVEIPLTSVNFSVISVFHLQHNILWSQSPIKEDIKSMQKSVTIRQYNIHVHPRNL